MHVRDYAAGDADTLAELFHETVHRVNARDYAPAQLEAWAPAARDVERARARFDRKRPFVAVTDGDGDGDDGTGEVVIGFAELDPDGHIDCFYVHHAHQRRGVGALLMVRVLDEARRRGLPRLWAEVSITARPFFARQGFHEVRAQEVDVRGVSLRNFVMERALPA